ncbi:hypothetical protein [Acidiphilium rubrum]|uniref:hypothetical protein n=1 Tax=Acidiphilium rubrum TaxID=526 RepID=UPI002D1FA436|nr:hypothetical protein [Acidiphilium rubrum]
MGWCAIRGVIAARMADVRFVASGRYFGVVAQEAMRWAAVLMVDAGGGAGSGGVGPLASR